MVTRSGRQRSCQFGLREAKPTVRSEGAKRPKTDPVGGSEARPKTDPVGGSEATEDGSGRGERSDRRRIRSGGAKRDRNCGEDGRSKLWRDETQFSVGASEAGLNNTTRLGCIHRSVTRNRRYYLTV